MATTMVSVLRELIQDNNGNPAKRIFTDDEIARVLRSYMRTYKQLRMTNLDGLGLRFESAVPYWLDGVESHKSADETQQFLLNCTIYANDRVTIVDPADYVVDTTNGIVIFTTSQTAPAYATFYATNPFHAGADLLDELASKKARSALGVQLGSLSVNMGKLPSELRRQADELRAQGGPLMGENLRSDSPIRTTARRNYPFDFGR